MKWIASLLLILALLVSAGAAPPAIFIVRHAEKANPAEKDPNLSETGRVRAESLARMLQDVNITAIYATEFKRTQQTAAPAAKALGLETAIIPAKDTAVLAEKLRSSPGNILVVGHGNTIPDLIKTLGLETAINIAENDYDNLFIIVFEKNPYLLRLHYR